MKPLVTAIVCAVIAVIGWRLYQRQHAPSGVVPAIANAQAETAVVLPVTSSSWSNLTSRPPAKTLGANATTTNAALTASGSSATPRTVNETAVQSRARELLARAALGAVGADPDADQYWLAAIMDENVPPEERRELILSLNDDRRSSPSDLPLIASRIALIEQAAPQAIDDGDAAALQEVYRDLLSMLSTLSNAQTASPLEPANAEPAR